MELVRWNPRKNLMDWPTRVDRIFDNFFHPALWDKDSESTWNWEPVADIYENDDHFVVVAELPGVDKKDIQVSVNGRILTLSGERTTNKEVKEESYCHRERSYGRFERSFTLPVDVDNEKVNADYKDGVLKIVIPKQETTKPRKITVH